MDPRYPLKSKNWLCYYAPIDPYFEDEEKEDEEEEEDVDEGEDEDEETVGSSGYL